MSEPGFAFPPGGMNARDRARFSHLDESGYCKTCGHFACNLCLNTRLCMISTVYSSPATSDSFEDEAIRVVDSLIEKARRGK